MQKRQINYIQTANNTNKRYNYEESRLLGYKHIVRTSQETHYLSATESSQLMLCKIWGLHGSDYEECRLLGYKHIVRTSQETHYVSATVPSRLMLCKIWGFHGGEYEEWRLLGYKNPVRTSQETHYVSATVPSRLMLCKIWGFHGGDYEGSRLLGCYAVWLLKGPTFRWNVGPKSSGWQKIGELGTLAVTNNRHTLRRNTIYAINTVYTIAFLRSVGRLLVKANVIPT
jgi:hypothetical protein